jgi:hypothetical protein
MSKVKAVLDQIEAEQRQQADSDLIPDHIPLPELAEQVVRGKVKLTAAQMRMLIELLPYHVPKLSTVGIGFLNAQDFASRLERAVNRTMKVIEHEPAQVSQPAQVNGRRRGFD